METHKKITLLVIFCPQCDTLLLKAEQCPNCGWLRPPVSGNAGQPLWAVALGDRLPRDGIRPTAGEEGRIYFPTEPGHIVALDARAAQAEQVSQWRYQLNSRYRCHGVTVWAESLLIGLEYIGGFPTPPAEFIVLNRENGQETWRWPVEGASISVPVVHQDVAYFTTNTGWLYAVDLDQQKTLWRQKVEPPWSWSPAAPQLAADNLLLLPGRSNQLAAFDIEQKRVAWQFSGDGWLPSTPVVVDDGVYVRCWDRHIYALEATTGQERWRYKATRDFSSELWAAGDYLYVGVKDFKDGAGSGPTAYALLVIDRRSGQPVNRYEVEGRIKARPITTDDALFFATDDRNRTVDSQGTLYACNRQSLPPLWPPCVVEQRFLSDLLLVDHLIIVGTRQGAVYAIPWQTAAEGETPQGYLDRGEWASAAVAYALEGAYLQAAELYADKLAQPFQAGQLYFHAGEFNQVIALLGSSPNENEHKLAVQAAKALPDRLAQAQALDDLGENLAAAEIYLDLEDWLAAGQCYEAAKAWSEARTAYAKAEAWDRWGQITRKMKRWDELIKRHRDQGELDKVGLIYLELGQYLKAARTYDEANLDQEALAAYRQVESTALSRQDHRRLAELAETDADVALAIASYRAAQAFDEAARLAETSAHYQQALEIYQNVLGNQLKTGDMLEKLGRYIEAAELFKQERYWGRAAENLERLVEQKIEQAQGKLRHVRQDPQVQQWLERAVALFKDEINEADDDTIDVYRERAERCQILLMQIRQEPLLKLHLQAKQLIEGQGNAIDCTIKNVGWGRAENLVLTISGNNLRYPATRLIDVLDPKQEETRRVSVVPEITGDIKLHIELKGQTSSNELHNSFEHIVSVIPDDARLTAMPSDSPTFILNNYISSGQQPSIPLGDKAVASQSGLWQDDSSSPGSDTQEQPITQKELNASLRKNQTKLPQTDQPADPTAPKRFNSKNIRTLLTEGFSDAELRRLCYDHAEFRPVYDQLGQEMGKDQVIDKLIEYAERKILIERLLGVTKALNPAMYVRHQPYEDEMP